MESYSHCPECHKLWHYKEIPEEYHENHSPPYYYSHVVACSTWEADRTLYYMCPFCSTRFDLSGNKILGSNL